MAIKIKLESTETELFCSSKWWGDPDFPVDMEYPTCPAEEDGETFDYPLTFVCQVDCEDIVPLDPENRLPHEGMLYVFAALDAYAGYESPIANGPGEWPKGQVMEYPGQRVQIDVKYVPQACLVGDAVCDAAENGGYYYQYTFIDEYSRFRYLEAFKEHNSYSSAEFIRHCVKKFPYAIECVQTDNGAEFTTRMNGSKTERPTLFQRTLDELGIQHKLIKVFTPRHNGKVERSHRKDNEYFYAAHKFYSFEDFQKQLAVWQYKYNDFPMRPLAWCSPKQVLYSFPNV